MGLFDKRKNLKPYEYPELLGYMKAIRQSYWVVDEFNFSQDIQDFFLSTPAEKSAIRNSILAIAQIEVAVKTFWGDLYSHMPKPELGLVGYSFAESECYIEGTEILTETGWEDISRVRSGDYVYQYNNGVFELVMVQGTVSRYYEGPVYEFVKPGKRCVVTPGHEMVYFDENNLAKKTAEEIGEEFYPEIGHVDCEGDDLTPTERVYIALHSNSQLIKTSEFEATYKVDLPEAEAKNLGILLDYSFLDYEETETGFLVHTDNEFNYNTLDWVTLSGKVQEWYVDFVQEATVWGLDDLDTYQAICILAGYNTTIEGVDLMLEGVDEPVQKFKRFGYAGNVSCVTVPSGVIITKFGDDTFIAGNCRHAEAYSQLLETMGLNREFEKIFEIPAINDRVDYLTKSLTGTKSRSEKEYVLSLLLFSVFIENVSLFSQFLILMSFNKYKNTFRGMSNVIQATSQEECYVEGTEIFTPNGWVDLKDVKVGDDVYQYVSGNLEPVKTTHVTHKEYEGMTYQFHNEDFRCHVTENHRMVYYEDGELKEKLAKDFVGNEDIPVASWDTHTTSPLRKDEIFYKGQVHCVTVPSGVIYTRLKDKTFVAGNCLHGQFGMALVNIIREENPEWFDEEFEKRIITACQKAYKAEKKVLDWIFEEGDLDFLPREIVDAFIKDRYNSSLVSVGLPAIFDVDKGVLEDVRWFNEELNATSQTDFFAKRPTSYAKFQTSITGEDLF